MRFLNKNIGIFNYTYSSKSKKAKLNNQKRKLGIEKVFNSKKDQKKQELKGYKIC